MILAGGDPSSLTLRHFIDAAYALIFEEYVRRGVSLHEAIEMTGHLRAGGAREGAPEPSEAAVELQNERSMQELQRMMAGVQVSE